MMRLTRTLVLVIAVLISPSIQAQDAPSPPKPEFPPFTEVLKGYDKVVSTADGVRSLYTLYVRKKDNQIFAELPPNYMAKKYFIALTQASGDKRAGLQGNDQLVYWRRYDKKLALIAPELDIRSSGEPESVSSIKRLFTDSVILNVPIVTIGPGGGPIIDLDYLLVGKATKFFGLSAINREHVGIFAIQVAKAFPENIEVAFEIPSASGKLQSLHYSISELPMKSTYKPRKADARVGYFTTIYSDYGKYSDDETNVRFINRWHLEKRDPSLKVSPPKNPIVFYIEHTTPVRYRRWVREGVLYWNDAFEKVGISNAIEVYYQDAQTGAHMDKDPEDVRYNFVRWLNNDEGTAIGPSRVNPMTGEILDADIILTDGWIRYFEYEFDKLLPKIAMEGYSAETLAWLAKHPDWDPRVRFAHPGDRERVRRELVEKAQLPFSGHPFATVDNTLLGDDKYDGLVGRVSQINGGCMAAEGLSMDVAMMRMMYSMQFNRALQEEAKEGDDADKDDEKEEKEEKEEKPEVVIIDGMPESYIGPQLAHVVAHEVGHTIGLRHNFKASSVYSLDEVNSKDAHGKPNAGSVMDYVGTNFRVEAGDAQGDYNMIGLGPYDYWAVEYGYSFTNDLSSILKRVNEPELAYATDEDLDGPDPLARIYDFGKEPIKYANERVKLANLHRGHLTDHFVGKGESWGKARRGYEITLGMQSRAISMMANWLGGIHVVRDKKGDPGDRAPLTVVSAEKQREALKFIIDNAFQDSAYGLSPEILKYMSVEKWSGESRRSYARDYDWPIHDRVMAIQASALTSVLTPTTLRRVFDNELRVPEDEDAFTLPELLDTVTAGIWGELDAEVAEKGTARRPTISSLRRNLQREHVKRLIDLSMASRGSNESFKPISNLSRAQLRAIAAKVATYVENNGENLDPYTSAHMVELGEQIEKALDANYIYNTDKIGGGGGGFSLFFAETGE